MSSSEGEESTWGSQEYRNARKIGEGTYAVVYRATEVETGETVAIKRIKPTPKTLLDISAIRELRALKALKHPNLLLLRDIFHTKDHELCLVLDYHGMDLEKLIKNKQVVFSSADIKAWMLMLLRGLAAMHQEYFLHRDIKPNNLLLAEDGVLKIADFGLTRTPSIHATLPMTPGAVTRWYRPPELLLGARHYGPAVDIWSAGCCFAELMLRTPFLVADTDVGMLSVMCRALGSPSQELDWPVK